MRRIINHIALLAAVVVTAVASLGSCTQNNGDIGPWFGFWRMTSITIGAQPVEGYEPEGPGSLQWSFQGNVVFINTLGPHNSYRESVATWSATATCLTLDYTHGAGQGDDTYLYTPPAILKISTDRPTEFTIVSLTSRDMTLRRTLDDGSVMECQLKKAY